MKQFSIGYHKAVKKIVGLRNHESNHLACNIAGLMTFKHYINWIKIRFASRILNSPCTFLYKSLLDIYDSLFFKVDVKNILSENYNITSRLIDNDIEAIKSRILFVQRREPTMR